MGTTKRLMIARKLQAQVFYRDKWLCHCCKRPVVFAPAMKYLKRFVSERGFTKVAYWRSAYDRHGAPLLDLLAAAVDHVKAFSKGGLNDIENLATICYKCNSRKNDADFAEWIRRNRVTPVKGKYGEPVDWDGFVSLFLCLAQDYADALSASEKDWVNALRSANQGKVDLVGRGN